jgi:hypothetical protein
MAARRELAAYFAKERNPAYLIKSYMGSSWNFYHGKWKAKLSSTTWNGGWRVRSKHMNVKASRLKKKGLNSM